MIKVISNEFLTVTISSKGAEIISVKTKDGTERLWQGGIAIWERQAPILFPWTGRMTGKNFSHNGKAYESPIHGFLREEEHSFLENDNTSIVSFFADFNNTNVFPFSFTAEQTFSLENETLIHTIKIINTSDTSMPFGLGFHPGFICPFNASLPTSDYSIVFDSPQTATEVLMEEGHPNGKENLYLDKVNTIQLSDTFFNNDSICLQGLTSKTIALCEKNSSNKIEINIKGFPYVLLWSATTPTLCFLCIEPWHTLPDIKDAPTEWTQKKNLLKLEKDKTFETKLSMSFFFEEG